LEERAVPATIYVGPGANRMYHTIQAAIDAAHNGDTVSVDAGTYREQVSINKNITVKGASRTGTIIQPPTTPMLITDGTHTFNYSLVDFVTGGENGTITNLTVTGAGSTDAHLYYGVRIDVAGANGVAADVINCNITNIVNTSDVERGVAIDVGNTLASNDGTPASFGNGHIQGNSITGYQRVGIVITGQDPMTGNGSWALVKSNTITAATFTHPDSQTGVEFSDGCTGQIVSNTIKGNANGSNGTGVFFFNPGVRAHVGGTDGGSDASIDHGWDVPSMRNNTITNCDYGIFGSGAVLTKPAQTVSVYVVNNTINNNTYVGIEFDNSDHVVITNNTVTSNGANLQNEADGGLYFFNTTNSNVENNKFNNNRGSGMYIDSGSTGNRFYKNQTKQNVYATSPVRSADVVDLTTGTGTAGTANHWIQQIGSTWITISGQSPFNKNS
jgi:parallel beta-helix repeat protein